VWFAADCNLTGAAKKLSWLCKVWHFEHQTAHYTYITFGAKGLKGVKRQHWHSFVILNCQNITTHYILLVWLQYKYEQMVEKSVLTNLGQLAIQTIY
jgi:hypothetical protein